MGPVDVDTIVYDDVVDEEEQQVDSPGRIGRYVVLEVLGVGGMGVVCSAYDPKLDRRVALKLLRGVGSNEARSTAGQARLVREAQALAKLSHPNIITVHDVDSADGKFFMAMEYVEGQTIREWLVARERTWQEILGVFVAAGRGLAAAHDAGLTHRDFKPSNVLIGEDGRVRVLDFGLATTGGEGVEEFAEMMAAAPKTFDDESSAVMDVIDSTGGKKLTMAGKSVGTPGYMAPEQHMGLPVEAASDQFGFGVSLFEALYSQMPFEETSGDGGFWALVEGPPLEVPKDSAVPLWVYKVVQRSLEREPGDRWPSMNAMLAALQADPARRRRRIYLGVAAAAFVGLSAWGVAVAMTPDETLCAGARDRLTGIWDAPTQDAVYAAFTATDKPYADDAWAGVSRVLDGYADSWVGKHEEVCEATHVRGMQSEQLLDVRMACLERGRSELRALTEVFVDADADVVVKSVAATHKLTDLEPCLEIREIPSRNALPDDPDARKKIDAVLGDVDRAKAQWLAGRYEEAVATATQAAETAGSVGHTPTHCEALQTLGVSQEKGRKPNKARASLEAAIECAAGAGAANVEANAWVHLLYLLGRELGQPETALALRLVAETAIERAGGDIEQRATIALYLAVTLSELGRHEEAAKKANEAVDLHVEGRGEQHAFTAIALGTQGAVLGRAGDLAGARVPLERALALTRKIQGDHHPEVASHALNLGNVLKNVDDLRAAQDLYELALGIWEESLGTNDRRVAPVHNQLGQVRDSLGDTDAARASFERALSIFEASEDPHPRQVASTLNNLGNVLLKQNKAKEALAQFDRALALVQPLDEHRQNARTLVNLCLTLTELGRSGTAVGRCREALEMMRRLGSDANLVKLAEDALAAARGR